MKAICSVAGVVLLLLLISGCGVAQCDSFNAPKIQPQENTDAYLWLEEIGDERALNWVKEKSEGTLAVLKSQPMFEETRQKALEILNSDKHIAYAGFQGKYLYNFWQDDKNERGLWRRTTLEEYLKPLPKWEILMDIDRLC